MMESPRALGRLVGVVPVVVFLDSCSIEGVVEDADDADDAGGGVSWRLC